MGTRGTYGFRHNGKEYLFYNHFDSYFTGLGINVINVIKSIDVETMRRAVDNHIRVKSDECIKTEQIMELVKTDVITPPDTDFTWHSVLRSIQYSPEYFADGTVRYWPLANDFIDDKIFCEWGYIIDLDAERLEIYRYGRNLSGKMTFDFIKEHDFTLDEELWESYYNAWPDFNRESLKYFVDFCRSKGYLGSSNYPLSELAKQKDSVIDVYHALEILKTY